MIPRGSHMNARPSSYACYLVARLRRVMPLSRCPLHFRHLGLWASAANNLTPRQKITVIADLLTRYTMPQIFRTIVGWFGNGQKYNWRSVGANKERLSPATGFRSYAGFSEILASFVQPHQSYETTIFHRDTHQVSVIQLS